jgi:Protein of unknown function (DUF1232)
MPPPLPQPVLAPLTPAAIVLVATIDEDGRRRCMTRGVRIRLGLLLAYLAVPIDLIPDFIPILGYADDAIIVTSGGSSTPASCGARPVPMTSGLT